MIRSNFTNVSVTPSNIFSINASQERIHTVSSFVLWWVWFNQRAELPYSVFQNLVVPKEFLDHKEQGEKWNHLLQCSFIIYKINFLWWELNLWFFKIFVKIAWNNNCLHWCLVIKVRPSLTSDLITINKNVNCKTVNFKANTLKPFR